MGEAYIEREEIESLPRWAAATFASRCARRAAPVLPATGLEGLNAVDRVLNKVDGCARTGTGLTQSEVFELLDEADDWELAYRGKSEDKHRAACHVIAAAKFSAYCIVAMSPSVAKNAWDAYRNAANAACFGTSDDPDEDIANSDIAYEQMRFDFEAAKEAVAQESIDDNTPVGPEIFGAMWPRITPTWAHGLSRWDEVK